MKAKAYVRTMRRVRWGCVVVLVGLVALGGMRAVSALRAGGSCITNPDAFASAQIAAGLRAVHQ